MKNFGVTGVGIGCCEETVEVRRDVESQPDIGTDENGLGLPL